MPRRLHSRPCFPLPIWYRGHEPAASELAPPDTRLSADWEYGKHHSSLEQDSDVHEEIVFHSNCGICGHKDRRGGTWLRQHSYPLLKYT